MNNFYFTFGTDEVFPYIGGWVVIKAETIQQAQQKFAKRYGYTKHGTLRYAFHYREQEFKTSCMYKEDNFGYRCHEIIE